MPSRKENKYKPLKRKVPISDLQKSVYDFIRAYRKEHNQGPTFAEVAKAHGGGKNNHMTSTLDGLRRRGMITWAPRVARSLNIVQRHTKSKPKKGPGLAKVHPPTNPTPTPTSEGPSSPSVEFRNTVSYIDERIRRLKLELAAMEGARSYLSKADSSS